MSNEPHDPHSAESGDPGSDPGEQPPAGDEVQQPPLVDEATAQSGDDLSFHSDSEIESPPADTTETEAAEIGATKTAGADGVFETGSAATEVTEAEGARSGSETDTADGVDGDRFDSAAFGPPDEVGSGPTDPGVAPPPQPGPIYQAPPPVRRLTRDPYSRLGGVASGIAHYYGIDVSLVRLAIVAFAVLTGIGFLLYLVAWLVIPRAEVWPPPPPPGGYRGGRMDNRQLALGLIALGLLIAVFAGGGVGTRVLIALGLIAGGVWIFNQRPAPAATPVTGPGPGPVPPVQSGAPVGAPYTSVDTSVATQAAAGTTTDPTGWRPSDAGTQWPSESVDDQMGFDSSSSDATGGSGGYEPPGQSYYQATAYPPPQPVPARRRRIWPFVLIGVLILAPILAVGGAFAAFVALEGGDVSFSSDNGGRYQVVADTPAEIPNRISEGTGELVVDLSDLDVDEFASEDGPVPLEVDMTAGQIVIELPEDLPVDVTADIGAAGEIQVFDDTRAGFRPEYSVSEPDAVLELDVHLGVGEIRIGR